MMVDDLDAPAPVDVARLASVGARAADERLAAQPTDRGYFAGGLAAMVGWSGKVNGCDGGAGSALRLAPEGAWIPQVAWIPDGRRGVVSRDTSLARWCCT